MASSIDHSAANPTNISLPLFQLPLELLLRITYFLGTEDLCRFRSSCKRAEESLHHRFVQEFFTCRVFALNEFSLQALIDISESRFGKCIRTLDFSIINLEYVGPRDGLTYDDDEAVLGRQVQATALSMFNSGQHTMMLQRAFASLCSLEVVRFRQRESPTRFRDGKYRLWQPYGNTTRQKLLPNSLLVMKDKRQSTTQVFTSVITALGLGQVSTLRSIELLDVQPGNAAFRINDYVEKSVQSVLVGLTRLHLYLSNEQYLSDGIFPELRRFLAHCTNVTDLRINTLQSEASQTVIFKALTPTSQDVAHLLKVETLDIGFAACSTADLLSFIKQFSPSLQSLKLWKVTLNDWIEADIQSLDYEDALCWKRFLRKLQALPGLNLRNLELGALKVATTGYGAPHFVNFKDGQHNIKYTGPLWGAFIGDISPHIESTSLKQTIERAKNPPTLLQDEDSEMDSDEEEDEDDEDDEDDEE